MSFGERPAPNRGGCFGIGIMFLTLGYLTTNCVPEADLLRACTIALGVALVLCATVRTHTTGRIYQ